MRRTAILLLTAALMFVTAGPGDSQVPVQTQPPPAARRPAVLLIDASATLVDALIFKRIDRTEPFMDVVKDIPNTGTRRTVGTVHGVLVPDATHGAVDIVFQGTTIAEGVGKRPFTCVYTTTATAVETTYHVKFDARGLCGARGPAGAGAAICLRDVVDIYGEHDSPVTNLVRLGFPQDKPELEGIVSRRAANQAAREQEAEVTTMLAKAGQTLGLAWAKQLGLDIGALEFATTGSYLEVRLPAASAPTPPPIPAGADFSVRVHESLLNEIARAGLGGRTFPLGELQRLAEKLLEPLLRDGRDEKDRIAGMKAIEKLLTGITGKASLTVAQNDPIRFTFADHGFTVEVHLARIQFDDHTLPGVRLKASYRLVNGGAGVELRRQGALQVIPDQPAGKDTLVLAAARAAVGLVSEEIFRERFNVVDLARPEGVGAIHADATRGWLSVGWKLNRGAGKGS